jgi:ElaB/YqjD/DUF883 family membrane-anchored ribosome-binding protein
MATPTPKDTADVGRIEHQIAAVRGDLGRTMQEIGTRLTPAKLMEHARRGLREGTLETTKAVAQSASDVASEVASRTRDVALDARDRVQAHPYTAGAIGAGIGLGYWLVSSAIRRPTRLVPREWDEPFDRSSRRVGSNRSRLMAGSVRASQLMSVGAAATAAWLIWKGRA